jgi:peroxiredoxin Q/BCP
VSRRIVIYVACLFLCACPSKQEPEAHQEELQPSPRPADNASAPVPDKPLAVGDVVFDFTALAHTGQRFQLSEFLQRPVLLYFCPSDRAPECSALALSMREHWLLLNPSLSMAFGVSADDTFVHRDFASEHELPHLLIADGDYSVHRLFGLELGVVGAYLVGSDRKILRVWNPVDSSRFAEQVRAALGELGLERPIPPM